MLASLVFAPLILAGCGNAAEEHFTAEQVYRALVDQGFVVHRGISVGEEPGRPDFVVGLSTANPSLVLVAVSGEPVVVVYRRAPERRARRLALLRRGNVLLFRSKRPTIDQLTVDKVRAALASLR